MKILHLEDSTQDAELARSVFQQEWPDCVIRVVDNRSQFLEQLESEHDVILSDFSLGAFDGLEALQLVREKQPDTPFIFLSGTIGEDRALEALRAGASDYLLKDRPKRLVPAIQRAMKDARLQRERRATAEQMLRVQRLESIGMLAAGIAHDFNNVLAPVIMGVSLFRGRLTNESDQRVLETIESSAARGTGLIRQILGFAQGVTGGMQIVRPRPLLRELTQMMQRTFPRNIRIVDEVEDGLWPVKANPTQLHQILLNLCVNARDAMPHGGTIVLRATNRRIDGKAGEPAPFNRAGDFVVLEVADNGSGIPTEILERIWDPFFTTKDANKGTGLGLSTVRGIVEAHGGTISVQTHAGQGTTFRVMLPARPGEDAVAINNTASPIPKSAGKLVLVADGNPAVRDATSAALTGSGYRVLSAGDGIEALALAAARSMELRAIVTDIDLPNLDGAALARVAGTLNPSVRIILTSDSVKANDPRRQPPSGGMFLPKPFSADTLVHSVEEVLKKPTVPAN